jgi:hypothetical protein
VRRKTWLAGAAVLVAVTALGGAVAISGADASTSAAPEPATGTATVTKGTLSAMVAMPGTLTHRARPDGSPYSVVNQARGVYTELPEDGDQIDCGSVLYRVDDVPVLLLCGTVPAYRDLGAGDRGSDVRQLNANLHQLGYDEGAAVDPEGDLFTAATERALGVLQRRKDLDATGTLEFARTVFLPEPVRIAGVTGRLGGSAEPGGEVVAATSGTLEVQVTLDAAQQGEVSEGDLARITLPGNKLVTGKVDRIGAVAQSRDERGDVADATIPAFIALDNPADAAGLDRAPVRVEITTTGVEDALSVPVTALLGKSGGGFAVEVVRDGDRRELVGVTLGLFDTTGGRVQVDGDLAEGDVVVVPAS